MAVNWVTIGLDILLDNSYVLSCPTEYYGLVQDYSISISNALEILQSCTKPSM